MHSTDPPTNLPLARFAVLATRDLDQAREEVARIFCPHRLETIGGSRLDACHHSANLGGFSLNYIRYGGDVLIEPGELGSFFLLQIPLGGAARIACARQIVDASPSTATMLSPHLHVSMRWSGACDKLLLQLPRGYVEQTLQAMLGRRIRAPIAFETAIPTDAGAGRRLVQFIHLLRDDLDSGAPIMSPAGAAARTREMLTMALLNGMAHSYSDALAAPVPAIAPRHVRCAEEYMRAHIADPVTITDLAAAAGVSVRSLHDGFRRFRDTTPLEALRDLRLDRARTALTQAGPADSVTSVALAWGFAHLSRFALSYSERFGEKPSDTLRRARMA